MVGHKQVAPRINAVKSAVCVTFLLEIVKNVLQLRCKGICFQIVICDVTTMSSLSYDRPHLHIDMNCSG